MLPLLLFCVETGYACGCGPKQITVLDAYNKSDLVVTARLVSVTKAEQPDRFSGKVSPSYMVVEKVFKGDVKLNARLMFGQGASPMDCFWDFWERDIGESYLLYLVRPEKPTDPFYVWGCNRSAGLDYAHDDLLFLNNLAKAKGRTRVSGTLKADDSEDENLAGRKIRIIGQGRTYTATTDKDGVYEIYDLPPGRYFLEPVLEYGWTIDNFQPTRPPTRAEMNRPDDSPPPRKLGFTLGPKKHFGADIELKLSNSVSGRVTTSEGKPLQWVCVSFAPVNPVYGLNCNSLTGSDGRFRIDGVAAGKYLLVINPDDKQTEQQPFPKLFYPGVTNQEDAKVIEVEHGKSLSELNFIIPPPK